MRLSIPVGNEAERAMWERWGRTYQEEGTASARAGMCLECWGTAREVNAQRGRGRAGEGEDTEASKGWTLCGLSKDLAFTQWELRSCCWVLNRGVLQPHLTFQKVHSGYCMENKLQGWKQGDLSGRYCYNRSEG